MMLSNVIVDVTIPRRSFVFGQSPAKVSNVRKIYLLDCKINLAPFARYINLSAGQILYILGSDYPIL